MKQNLVKLEIEHVLGVKAMILSIDGKSVSLIGKNEAGKTSIIQALGIALGQITDGNPTQNGERKGKVIAEFDDYIISKEWKNGKMHTWKVEGKNGSKDLTPKELLDSFIDTISYRPDDFINRKAADRLKVLAKAVGYDLDEHNRRHKEIFDKRTEIGRDRKKTEGILDALKRPTIDTPEKELSISDLLAELEGYKDKARERSKIELDLQSTKRIVTDIENEINHIQIRLQELTAKRDIQKDKLSNLMIEIGKVPNFDYHIESVNQKLTNIEKINAEVRMKQKYDQTKQEYEKYDLEYDNKTQELENLKSGLTDKISQAGLPDGFELIDNEIYVNKVHFDKLSTFQKLDFAMKIGMRIKPIEGKPYTQILSMDVSQYDQENRAKVLEIAEQNGYQVILEIAHIPNGTVPSELSKSACFFIDDGTAELMEVANEN
ncbi:MAG: AAA family ATPase [Candidatus Kapabacteria bacterium]|nr:AAA family ATPase [Candidatus Kapabacteria bacterium]